MKNLIKVIAVAICFQLQFSLQSQQIAFNPIAGCVTDPNGECLPNAVLSAVPFLRITPDARSGAMGDAGIATSADPSAIHFNASKLAFAEKEFSIAASYTPWLRALGLSDVYYAYVSGYRKLDELQSIGFGFKYFSLGDINFTDFNGNPQGMGRPREMEIAFSYARQLSSNFSAALSTKYIYSNLATGFDLRGIRVNSGQSFASDVSFTYKKYIGRNDLTIGMALSNLGSKISYTNNELKDFIPANFGIGASYLIRIDEYNSLTFSMDLNKLMNPSPVSKYIDSDSPTPVLNPEYDTDANGTADFREKGLFPGMLGSFTDAQGGFSEELKEVTYSLGFEYWYDRQFAVRAGYFHESELKGDRKYITTGIGINYNVFGLNLSYLVPTNNRRNPLDNTLRFTLIFDIANFQG